MTISTKVNCAICLVELSCKTVEEYNSANYSLTSPCLHLFHASCLAQAQVGEVMRFREQGLPLQRTSCPNCRDPFGWVGNVTRQIDHLGNMEGEAALQGNEKRIEEVVARMLLRESEGGNWRLFVHAPTPKAPSPPQDFSEGDFAPFLKQPEKPQEEPAPGPFGSLLDFPIC